MGFGSNGAILRVDLTSGTTGVETFDEAFYRRYPGGKALAAYHLLREMPAGADPLGPDNVLVLADGPPDRGARSPPPRASTRSPARRSPAASASPRPAATGARSSRWRASTRSSSPGARREPVWIWVRDGEAEIRDARALWGQDPPTVQAAIKEAVGEKNAPRPPDRPRRGEPRPVRDAHERAAPLQRADRDGRRDGLQERARDRGQGLAAYAGARPRPGGAGRDRQAAVARRVTEHPQGWDLRTKGTPGLTDGLNAAGILPTRNFRLGSFEQVEGIGWARVRGDPQRHPLLLRVRRPLQARDRLRGRATRVTDTYDGPEYEAIAGFGSNCAIFDLQLVARANELCNELGLDVISTAGTVAFVMECVEHGLLGPARPRRPGPALRQRRGAARGDPAHRRPARRGRAAGPGLAADRRAAWAASAGLRDAGQGPRAGDARAARQGRRRAWATRPTRPGADHLVGFHDPHLRQPRVGGVQGRACRWASPSRPARSTWARRRSATGTPGERWNSAEKVLGLCFFGPAPRSFIQVDDVVAAVRAATGWDVTVDELLEIGERAVNMARLFNVREGFTARGRPAARPPPHPARGRAADGDVDRPGRVRGGDHRACTSSRAGTRRPASPTPERLRAPGPRVGGGAGGGWLSCVRGWLQPRAERRTPFAGSGPRSPARARFLARAGCVECPDEGPPLGRARLLRPR